MTKPRKVSTCPHCGAPVYQAAWDGLGEPPRCLYSCDCRFASTAPAMQPPIIWPQPYVPNPALPSPVWPGNVPYTNPLDPTCVPMWGTICNAEPVS